MQIRAKKITGLTDTQVLESRQRLGENRITTEIRQNQKDMANDVMRQPRTYVLFFILLLTIACFVMHLTTEGADAYRSGLNLLTIVLCVAASATIAIPLRVNARRRNTELLLNQDNVQVIRNGNNVTIPYTQIVVGDIVVLSPGSFIPADGQLLEAHNLIVDETNITGDISVLKEANIDSSMLQETRFAPDKVMCGSTVTEGNGIMRVTRIGNNTEYGKMTHTKGAHQETSPIVNTVRVMSSELSLVAIAIAVVINIIALFTGSFDSWYNRFTIFILIFGAMMPLVMHMTMNILLAQNGHRFSRMGIILRHFYAPTTLGASKVLLTDKTGLISSNQMQVLNAYVGFCEDQTTNFTSLFPEIHRELMAQSIALNTTANLDLSNPHEPVVLGDVIDGTLLLWLHENKIDYRRYRSDGGRTIERLAYSESRHYMATLIENNKHERILFVKGEPEPVVALCHKILLRDEAVEICPSERSLIETRLIDYGDHGYSSSVAFAYAYLPKDSYAFYNNKIDRSIRLTLLGFVSMEEIMHRSVRKIVKQLKEASIEIKLISVSNKAVSLGLARRAGIITLREMENPEENGKTIGIDAGKLTEMLNEGTMTGKQLRDVCVISQASHADKVQIVNALKNTGIIVSVVGSESRDVPMLGVADVGITMNLNSTTSPNVGSMNIMSNHLERLLEAIKTSRSLIMNLTRFYLYQFSVSVSLVLLTAIGMLAVGEPIVSMLQMFWSNVVVCMIVSFAFAAIPPDDRVMARKPEYFHRFLKNKHLIAHSLIFASLITLHMLVLWLIFSRNDITAFSDIWTKDVTLGFPERLSDITMYERTLILTSMAYIISWLALNVRAWGTLSSAFFNVRSAPRFYMIIILGVPITLSMLLYIMGETLLVAPLSFLDHLFVILSTSWIVLLSEPVRAVMAFFFRKSHNKR